MIEIVINEQLPGKNYVVSSFDYNLKFLILQCFRKQNIVCD